ncbi:hypothetical protein AXF42_Ash018016 [Apostasia shenzhenica]|uniref:Uncharacterized protein n=1 Tax=Apostasia shenzhenica TaxID=1088818 RepID=A0A2I0A562_9ASPA|nr:hypothetical protein AXF42_Ash018016 [Apostasia shenzhenica]
MQVTGGVRAAIRECKAWRVRVRRGAAGRGEARPSEKKVAEPGGRSSREEAERSKAWTSEARHSRGRRR